MWSVGGAATVSSTANLPKGTTVVDPARAAEGMCRPEIEDLLREGEQKFVAALDPTSVVFRPGELLTEPSALPHKSQCIPR